MQITFPGPDGQPIPVTDTRIPSRPGKDNAFGLSQERRPASTIIAAMLTQERRPASTIIAAMLPQDRRPAGTIMSTMRV
jgi:hypothetical protein